jgi:hypothetical protein
MAWVGRMDLSLESLSKALERVGYRLNFVPTAGAQTHRLI